MRNVRVMLVIAVAFGVASCNGSRPGQIALVVDPGEHRDETFQQWNVPVDIQGEVRVALSASKPQIIDHELTDTEVPNQKMMLGTIPASFKAVPLVILGPANVANGVPAPIRVWPIIGGQMGKPFRFPLEVTRVTPGGKASVVVWPVPALASRDIRTQPVTVPSRAVLRVGMGLESACWPVMLAPVDLIVSAVDETGAEVQVGSTTLNAYKPEARQWVDQEFSLDALAGKTMRFRFAARMTAPEQIQYALPVFSEPRIGDADS